MTRSDRKAKHPKPQRAITRQTIAPAPGRRRDPRAGLRVYGEAARCLEDLAKHVLATGDREAMRMLVHHLMDLRKRLEQLPKIVATPAQTRKIIAEAFAAGFSCDDPPKTSGASV